MSEPDKEHVQEAERWLVYAGDDLAAAEVLAGDPHVSPRQACWLAQQAAEKALKAALCFLRIDFGKTHNLDLLRNLLPQGWSVKEKHPDLAELTAWAIEGRYPGDWPEATPEDARMSLDTARSVLEVTQRDLQTNGFREG